MFGFYAIPLLWLRIDSFFKSAKLETSKDRSIALQAARDALPPVYASRKKKEETKPTGGHDFGIMFSH